MKSKLILASSVAMLMIGAALPAHAVLLNFDLSGSRNAVFQLDSNPMPDSSSSSFIGDQIGFTNVLGTYNGAPGTASISFGTDLIAALNINGTSLGFTQFAGPALFSGLATAPVFATGVYNLTSIVSGASTLTISDAAVSGVPEPSIWATLIAGLGLMGFALRRRPKHSLAVAT